MDDPKTDLNQLVIFVKVVETRSFTAAGRLLGLPKSTVSRKIAQLEERLGERLLQRTTRRLALTDVGAAFYERCARIATEVDEAEQAVRNVGGEPQGRLRICASADIGARFLSEVVGEYLLSHPEVDVELEMTNRAVDRVSDRMAEGCDLVLCAGRPGESGMIVRRLGSQQRLWVASPSYLAERGTPGHPRDLAEHATLIEGRGDLSPKVAIELRHGEGERWSLELQPRMVVNDTTMLRRAALAGAGLALLPSAECAGLLKSGRLQVVLRDWSAGETAIHAVYPTARHLSTKVRRFLELVTERLEPVRVVSGAGRGRGAGMSLSAC